MCWRWCFICRPGLLGMYSGFAMFNFFMIFELQLNMVWIVLWRSSSLKGIKLSSVQLLNSIKCVNNLDLTRYCLATYFNVNLLLLQLIKWFQASCLYHGDCNDLSHQLCGALSSQRFISEAGTPGDQCAHYRSTRNPGHRSSPLLPPRKSRLYC